jgi:pimeloyl-ACP methyl ester carboxylesterase
MSSTRAGGRGGKPRFLVVLPGNPGDAAFYQAFVQELERRGHEATVASHPCLFEAPADLLVYARHQAASARRHLADRGRTVEDVELILVGHSVGGYLAYLIVAHGLLPVARVILLFPFLMRPALRGRLILRALAAPWLVRVGLAALRGVPRVLRRWLITRAGAADLAPLVLPLFESREVLGCVSMAVRERQEIASRQDARYLLGHALFQQAETFATLLCERDFWAPAALAAQLPGARLLPAPVSHTFVVDARQRQLVAEAVHQLLMGGELPA